MRAYPVLALIPIALSAAPAWALDPPAVASVHASGEGQAEAVLLFTGGGAVPRQIDGVVRTPGGDRPVTLELADAPPAAIAPSGFARVRYRFTLPEQASGALTLVLPSGSAFAFAGPAGAQEAPTQVASSEPAPAAAAPSLAGETPRPGNPALGNLTAFNPMYAAFGRGTNSDGKIQISLKYQLFGRADAPTGSWMEGFHFGYTQRMLWDVGGKSAPFRDVNYQPELFYLYKFGSAANPSPFTLRGGFLHESNGRSGDASRAYNIVYIQPSADIALGSYTLSVAPRYFGYVFGRDGNEDIARYRGHQALGLAIGTENGLKLSTWSRINFGTGKGSVDGELTYPLSHLIGSPLFLTVQGFTGYGEDLLDYNRKQTRLRLGLAIVR